MPDLTIALDIGGSRTKVIFQSATMTTPAQFSMPPEVEQIHPTALTRHLERKNWLSDVAPQQQAWLEIGEETWVAGEMAQCFNPQDRLRERKYENGLYKAAAVIGILVESQSIATNRLVTISLGILLPSNEYNDRKRFQAELETMLKDFQFRGKRIRIKVEYLTCKPEGGGLLTARFLEKQTPWFKSHKIGVLMLGHRNTTTFYSERGDIKEQDSPHYGFAEFLDRVLEMTSDLDRQALTEAIFAGIQQQRNSTITQFHRSHQCFQARYPNWSQVKEIDNLVTVKRPALRIAEVKEIAQAIETATQEYWDKLSKWLERKLPAHLNLDEVLVSGGAALFLEPKLEQYFRCEAYLPFNCPKPSHALKVYQGYHDSKEGVPMVWDAGLQEEIQRLFRLQEGEQQFLTTRLADAFGIFKALKLKQAEQEKAA